MSSLSFRPKVCDNEHLFSAGPADEMLFLKCFFWNTFNFSERKKACWVQTALEKLQQHMLILLKKPQKRSSLRQTTHRRPPVKLPIILLMLEDMKWTLNCAQTLSIGPTSVYTAAGTSRTLMQMLHLFQSVWNGSPKLQITANYLEAQAVASLTTHHFTDVLCLVCVQHSRKLRVDRFWNPEPVCFYQRDQRRGLWKSKTFSKATENTVKWWTIIICNQSKSYLSF